MRTNTVIIGLVLAVLVIAGGVYAYSSLSGEKETITAHYELTMPLSSGYLDGEPVIEAKCNVTWTSSTGDPVYMTEHLDLVLKRDGVKKVLHLSITPQYANSGESVPWYLEYYSQTATPVDLTGWSYSFELTENMKKAGNYKIE